MLPLAAWTAVAVLVPIYVAASTSGVDDSCRVAIGTEDSGADSSLQLLQAKARKGDGASDDHGNHSRTGNLMFVHVPCTFGHTVEEVGLQGSKPLAVYRSFAASSRGDIEKATELMMRAKGPDGELWGMFHPKARDVSPVTGCNYYYTPGKYWPKDLAEEVFGGKELFAMLRDPYDRVVNDFRMQAQGMDSVYMRLSRADVSNREGNDRESPRYLKFYETCDVNGYVKAELTAVLNGDRFRANCHYLPQAEYYEQPYGATAGVDNRKIPESFNDFVHQRGYPWMQMNSTFHNFMCNQVSAYSLDEEAKALVRKAYAADFMLLCDRFGYCDDKEMTCLESIPNMCGSKPAV